MEIQKNNFYSLLEDYILNHNSLKQDSVCINQDKYEKIIAALKLDKGQTCQSGANFKFWCTQKFKLINVGSQKILQCSTNSLPVVTKENLFHTIWKCHEHVGHSGRSKTWDEIRANYSWVKHGFINLFLQTCAVCGIRKPLKKPPTGKPIISLGFLTRVQVDLIDMSSHPDIDNNWIMHARDHFTKFSWAYPLKSKRASEVAERLIAMFCQFGPPKILQSDNGREFVAEVINHLTVEWKGLVIIHGRPRHPQSQGCVERGNGDLQVKLGKWMDEKGGSWSDGLKYVVHAINTSTASATGKTPYELVFGQPPRASYANLEMLAQEGILNEDDLPDGIFEEPSFNDKIMEFESESNQTIESDDRHILLDQESNVPRPIKRAREYNLLYDGNVIGKGLPLRNRTELHGHSFNTNRYIVVEVTSVLNEDFIPFINNPFQEPIGKGQYILWNQDSLVVETYNEAPHKYARLEAQDKYMKTATRQQIRYDSLKKGIEFEEGDIVGIQINNVDRTNTGSRTLPCKVKEVLFKENKKLYKLYTASGIIKANYSGQDLVDLKTTSIPGLENIKSSELPVISLIAACRRNVYSNDGACSTVCFCKGSCITKKCNCMKAGLKCSTKCHINSTVCQNRYN